MQISSLTVFHRSGLTAPYSSPTDNMSLQSMELIMFWGKKLIAEAGFNIDSEIYDVDLFTN